MTTAPDPRTHLPQTLLDEVADCGFYPAVVISTLAGAIGRRPIVGHLVHHEATFAGHEVHRHLTVLALVDGAFIICHADEGERGNALVTTELIRLATIDSVILTQSVANPDSPRAGLAEAWLTLVWGSTRRIDLGPASCDDPSCDADHGYSGVSTSDDYAVRMSRDADGSDSLSKLVAFGELMQEAVQ